MDIFGASSTCNQISRSRKSHVGAFLLLLAGAAYGAAWPACAQDMMPLNPTPPTRAPDVNNIDLNTGVVSIPKVLISGGDPARPLTAMIDIRTLGPQDFLDRLTIDSVATNVLTSQIRVQSYGTAIGNFVFKIPPQWNGSTTLWSIGASPGAATGGSAGTLVNRNGDSWTGSADPNLDVYTFADGEVWTFYYTNLTYAGGTQRALKFVVSSRGYGIQLRYDNSSQPNYTMGTLYKITFYNKAYVYCDETLRVDCPAVSSLPTTGTISQGGLPAGFPTPKFSQYNPGDNLGNYYGVWSETYATPGEQGLVVIYGNGSDQGGTSFTDVVGVQKAGVASSTRYYNYVHNDGNGDPWSRTEGLYSAGDGTNTWQYTLPSGTSVDYPFYPDGVTATDPNGKTYASAALSFAGTPAHYTDELGRLWGFSWDGYNNWLSGIGYPEGNSVVYTFDGRGNPTEERHVPKASSSLPDIVRTAGYPATCTNYATCNKPSWIKDAKNSETDFTYKAENGGVETATGPADANGIRPQKRYTYVQRYAWVLNSAGGYVHSGAPIWLLANESYCRTSAATGNPAAPCTAGANDEVKTVYDYGPDSGPNNLFLRGVTVTAEKMVSGALTMVTLRTCYGNDRNGRRIWTTKPRANLASCS